MTAVSRNRTFSDATLDEDFSYQVTARWQLYNSDALSKIRLIQQQGLANILALLFGGGSQKLAMTLTPVPSDEAYELVRKFLHEQSIYLSVNRKEFTRRYTDSPELQQVVTRIQGVTDEVKFALQPQQKLQGVVAGFYSGGKELVLDTTRGPRGNLRIEKQGEAIPLKFLSSGEKQLLRLLLEVLTAEASTVMIDEPELSMHVDWQQRLVESMRSVNPDCQLILATHSPEVMADVDDAHVFEL